MEPVNKEEVNNLHTKDGDKEIMEEEDSCEYCFAKLSTGCGCARSPTRRARKIWLDLGRRNDRAGPDFLRHFVLLILCQFWLVFNRCYSKFDYSKPKVLLGSLRGTRLQCYSPPSHERMASSVLGQTKRPRAYVVGCQNNFVVKPFPSPSQTSLAVDQVECEEIIAEEEAICKICFKKVEEKSVIMRAKCKCKSALTHEGCISSCFTSNGNNCDVCTQEVKLVRSTLLRSSMNSSNETRSGGRSFVSWLRKLSKWGKGKKS